MVENLDEYDQFISGRDFIRNFDVTIDLNNAMFRIRNPERKYVIKGREIHVEQCGRRVIPENKEGVV